MHFSLYKKYPSLQVNITFLLGFYSLGVDTVEALLVIFGAKFVAPTFVRQGQLGALNTRFMIM